MQLIAAKMGGRLTNEEFALTVVSRYLKPAKLALSATALWAGIEHPHYTESYYLLAKES